MTPQESPPIFFTDPEEVRFSESSEEIPRYTEMPDGIYRLLTDKAETHIILQATTTRKIIFSRDSNCWKTTPPRFPTGVKDVFNNSNLFLHSSGLGRSFHLSEETGWETIASWSNWEEIPLLELAKASIAEDQAKLLVDYEKEQQRRNKRSQMHNAIAGNTSEAQQ